MATVTIQKKEYQELIEKKMKYEYLRQVVEGDVFSAPVIKDRKEIIKAFKKSNLHNKSFIASLQKGLRRSAYFR